MYLVNCICSLDVFLYIFVTSIRFVECSNKILNKNRTKNCSDGVDDKGDNDDDVESDMMIIGEDGDDK